MLRSKGTILIITLILVASIIINIGFYHQIQSKNDQIDCLKVKVISKEMRIKNLEKKIAEMTVDI